jgi:arginyl-tRNA synthetase
LCIAVPALKLGKAVMHGKELAEKYHVSDLIPKVFATGVFINFSFNNTVYRQLALKQAITTGLKYGTNSNGLGNLAVVEFSSPNIAKPFHAGHLRSTIIGNFIKNVLDANGWSTLTMNYLGDWGKQYGLLAVGFERHGNEADLTADPIKHLYDVYVKVNTEAAEDETVHDQARSYFARMEAGDTEALALWQRFRDLSIVKYKEMYARLNISFDVYSGESQYSLSMMREVLEELEQKRLLIPDGGALIVDLKPYDIGTAVIGKSDGSMLYLSRDIAAAQDRYRQFDFDDMYYCVGIQQDHHFRQLFKVGSANTDP